MRVVGLVDVSGGSSLDGRMFCNKFIWGKIVVLSLFVLFDSVVLIFKASVLRVVVDSVEVGGMLVEVAFCSVTSVMFWAEINPMRVVVMMKRDVIVFFV